MKKHKFARFSLLLAAFCVSAFSSTFGNVAQATTVAAVEIQEAQAATVNSDAKGVGKDSSDANQLKAVRNWTCDASIQLIGGSASWAPPQWSMSGGFLVDREKACWNFLKTNFLDDGEIWVHIKSQLTAAQQDTICKAGKGTFRVDYGFDTRKKDWSQTLTVTAPPCNCPKNCPQGYHLSGNGNCAKGMCQTGSLPNQAYFNNGQGHFIYNGTLYHQVSGVPSGPCSFK